MAFSNSRRRTGSSGKSAVAGGAPLMSESSCCDVGICASCLIAKGEEEAKKAKRTKQAKRLALLPFLPFSPFLLPLGMPSKYAHFVEAALAASIFFLVSSAI